MNLFECVPNLSEGRCAKTIAALAEASQEGGATLLHRTSDPDHHRTVLTLAGTSEELEASLLSLFEAARTYLDLRQHAGIHPRIGAVDVVPIIPLANASMDDARRLAEKTGRAVAQRFRLPVFLYEAAARQPVHRNLADIRRGGLGGVEQRMQLTDGRPDFGPPRLHPNLGATVVGARFFLVAFNVVLGTSNVKIAKKIARHIRASSGGLPAVKALGVFLAARGLAQVSMNLVDYRQTSLFAVFEQIADQARRAAVEIVDSELIGLIPQGALSGGAPEDLKLKNFSEELVLENKLREHFGERAVG